MEGDGDALVPGPLAVCFLQGLPGKVIVQEVEESLGPRWSIAMAHPWDVLALDSVSLLGSPEADPQMTFTVQILTPKCPSSTDGPVCHRHILSSEPLASASLPWLWLWSSKGRNTSQLPRGFSKERQLGAYHD